ncbi:SPRY-domain-containing protein [Schizopora paradoxa]|uniref:SPRY-domain-containing protein n=1 Tax=Schizopora paradoxa TaxID=27342 RepID=A0A0H2R1D3_9AGAM|nr:SPRY-domain-containing protein [Schizopora paradoxa]
MSTPRRPSRSASIPIPGASGRSLNDLLNFNNLSPAPTTSAPPTSPRQERAQAQQRSIIGSRSFYSGLEGMRPPSTTATASSTPGRTVGTSSSLGSATSGPVRHPLGGGSGGPWAASRSVSTSSTLLTGGAPHHHQHRRTTSAQAPRLIMGFEPRIIQGTPTGPRDRHGATSNPEVGQPGSPRSPVRRRESHDGISTSPTRALRISTGGTAPRRLGTLPPPHEVTEPGSKVATQSNAVPQFVSQLPTGGPVPFSRPTYLQYSALHDFIHTDENSTARSVAEPNPLQFDARASSSVRDATPVTESDDDSESSTGYVSRVRRPSGIRGREADRGRLRERQHSYVNTTGTDEALVLQVPTKWSDQDRNQFLKISEDGRNVQFHGPSSQGEKEAAAVRADHSVPPACGIYYYEVTIMDKGSKGHISIGFSTKAVRLTRLPGWEKDSWGYHGDDGHSFASERDGTPFGPRFTTGDVIGCGIDFSRYKAFYTKNGSFLGYAFENVGRDTEVYPSVGLRTSGESIRANFGHDTFRYDIDYHVHRAREQAWSNIQSTPVKWSIDDARDIFTLEVDKEASSSKASSSSSAPGPSGLNKDGVIKNESDAKVKQENADDEFVPIQLPPDYREPLDKLVMSYLQHHGYEKTARALQARREDARKKARALQGASNPKSENIDVDIKMETDDELPGTSTREEAESLSELQGIARLDSLQSRQKIVTAVTRGDIDSALRMAQEECPVVLEINEGLMLFKLRCRKFVELMLETSEAMKKATADTTGAEEEDPSFDYVEISENGTAMEVDGVDESTTPVTATNGFANGNASKGTSNPMDGDMRIAKHSPAMVNYQRALSESIAYGRKLQSDYRTDMRLEVQTLLKRTFSLVSYDDPTTATAADVVELVSQEARVQLAQEMNQAILESQGRPSRPALERVYRQASATVKQLALWGVGEAAFADVRKEFGETTI